MIGHLVLFRPRAALTADRQQALLESLSDLVRKSPAIRSCRVGRRVRHGLPGYEQAMTANYEFVLLLEFDDVDGLRAYLTAPQHASLGDFFTSGSDGLAYDYEMVDLGDAGRLL